MQNPKGKEILPIGRSFHDFEETVVGLPVELMYTHLLLAGASGAGKSTVMIHLTLEWAKLGLIPIFFDTKGDECQEIIKRIPFEERRRIRYLSFKAANFSIPILNSDRQIFPSAYHSASSVCKVIEDVSKRRGDALSVRQYRFLQESLYAVMKGAPLLAPGQQPSMLDVKEFLLTPSFRDSLLSALEVAYPEDGQILQICRELKGKEKDLTFDALLSKIYPITDEPTLSKVFAQRGATLDLQRIVSGDEGAIVLVDLSDLPVDILHLSGAILFECFLNACFLRPKAKRIGAMFLLDEFYLYWSESMSAVTRARSYRMGFVYAMQSEASISPRLMRTILDSIGCTMVMRCGGNYARLLSKQFGDRVPYKDLVELPNYHCWIKTPQSVFSFQTIPLPKEAATPSAIPLPPAPPEEPPGPKRPKAETTEAAPTAELPFEPDIHIDGEGYKLERIEWRCHP